MSHNRTNVSSIVTSALSGLAGGAAIASPFGPLGMLVGSIVAGYITGFAEYVRELRTSNHNNKDSHHQLQAH